MSQSTHQHVEHRWPATAALGFALLLYLLLPSALVLGPKWVIPVLEACLAVPLTLASPHRKASEATHLRVIAVALIALLNIANIASVLLLIHALLGGKQVLGRSLVYAALEVWSTNFIVFGLWFWEIDRGGPGSRAVSKGSPPDFLFPQMSTPQHAPPNWSPTFIDYLYVALTNATAFSPTDTMPLSPLAKVLMSSEAFVALITVVVVAARAVNILQ